jgi:hypothetical protein
LGFFSPFFSWLLLDLKVLSHPSLSFVQEAPDCISIFHFLAECEVIHYCSCKHACFIPTQAHINPPSSSTKLFSN